MSYAAICLGQGPLWNLGIGGWMTSYGMIQIAKKLNQIGVKTEVFNFDDKSALNAVRLHALHEPTMMFSYSLGNTLSLWIQTMVKVDLLFCIALSELAGSNNHPLHKANLKRSVLWRGPGILSEVVLDGFDYVGFVEEPHLAMDYDPRVQASAILEAHHAIDR